MKRDGFLRQFGPQEVWRHRDDKKRERNEIRQTGVLMFSVYSFDGVVESECLRKGRVGKRVEYDDSVALPKLVEFIPGNALPLVSGLPKRLEGKFSGLGAVRSQPIDLDL